jgi:hypothetical protein
MAYSAVFREDPETIAPYEGCEAECVRAFRVRVKEEWITRRAVLYHGGAIRVLDPTVRAHSVVMRNVLELLEIYAKRKGWVPRRVP